MPLLSAANWGGQGLHLRGNFEGYHARRLAAEMARSARRHALHAVLHAITGRSCRRGSSATSSKARTTAGSSSRRCCCNVRHPGEKFVQRAENEWPLARTQWTKFYLDPAGRGAGDAKRRTARRRVGVRRRLGDGVTFSTPPMTKTMEITGPVAAKLFVSSDTSDADLFLVLRVFDPAGKEVTVHRRPTIRACRWGSAGCAPRTASSIRRETCRYRP